MMTHTMKRFPRYRSFEGNQLVAGGCPPQRASHAMRSFTVIDYSATPQIKSYLANVTLLSSAVVVLQQKIMLP